MTTYDLTKAKEILSAAADVLEKNVTHFWGKRAYFSAVTDVGCTMCAHGAIAYAGIPNVRNNLAIVPTAPAERLWQAVQMVAENAAEAAEAREAAEAAEETDKPAGGVKHMPVESYSPPDWVSEKDTHMAHYLAFRAGLSFEKNDAAGTTKEEVIALLREAAQ